MKVREVLLFEVVSTAAAAAAIELEVAEFVSEECASNDSDAIESKSTRLSLVSCEGDDDGESGTGTQCSAEL